jgi:hypothetical protein
MKMSLAGAAALIMIIVVVVFSLIYDSVILSKTSHRTKVGSLLWQQQSTATTTTAGRSISMVVDLSSDDENNDLGSTISRLAFAKMLQIEVFVHHQIELKLMLTNKPNILLQDCFPNIMSEFRVLKDKEELSLRDLSNRRANWDQKRPCWNQQVIRGKMASTCS